MLHFIMNEKNYLLQNDQFLKATLKITTLSINTTKLISLNFQIFIKILEENIRTNDVISDVKSFSDLMISPKLCDLLNKHQYFTPTPVQAKAIPLLLFGTGP